MPATTTVHRIVVERVNSGNCIRLSRRRIAKALPSSARLGDWLRAMERSKHDFVGMDLSFAFDSSESLSRRIAGSGSRRQHSRINANARFYGGCFECHIGLRRPIPWFATRGGLRAVKSRRRRSQLPARCRAVSTQPIKAGAANGLARKQMAPPFKAEARTLSSGKAVIKITGAT